MSLALEDTEAVLRTVDRATEELGFCRNRVWAIAKSLPGGPGELPKLFPAGNIPLPETKREDHQLCTFDFCEQSRVNFTLVTQRHESPCKGARCPSEDFPSVTIEEAIDDNQPITAWNIEGKYILRYNERYMAISHVWSDGTGAGSQAPGHVNKCLLDLFRRFARDFKCEGLWWDTICIPTNKRRREKALKRMQLNYRSAAVTLVHDCFLRECEWRDADLACFHIVMSPWFSRGWTALELKMSQKVRIIFKDPQGHGLVTKDLDMDILSQAKGKYASVARGIIERLRKGDIARLDLLLAVLGPRHTSWPRDMAIISGLMIGIELPEDYAHQKIYQVILQTLGEVSHAHLFHSSGTMVDGYNWCPTDIYDLHVPATLPSRTLRIERNGNLLGEWMILSLDAIGDERFVLGHAHPLIEGKVRLARKEKDRHILLIEPDTITHEIVRALLVRPLIRRDEAHLDCYCDYIGPVYFYPPLTNPEIASFDRTPCMVHVGQDDIHKKTHQSTEGSQTAKGIIEEMQKHGSLPPQFRGRENDLTKLDLARQDQSKLWQEFMRAAADGDFEFTKRLLEVVADPHRADQSGSSALHLAVWNGHLKVTKLLLAARLNARQINSRGEEPLHLAVERGNKELVCTLLPYSTPNLNQEEGLTALHLAAKQGLGEIVKEISKKEWKINAADPTGQTSLHMASFRDHRDAVAVLIEADADIDLKDNGGRTAFSLAVFQGHGEIAKLLWNGGADPNSLENGAYLLFKATTDDSASAIRILAGLGANLESRDNNGRTPLHSAAIHNKAEAIRILARLGANLESRDSYGWTPLHSAASYNKAEAIRILAGLGANLESRDNHGGTPLHFAVSFNNAEAIRILVDLGANLESRDNHGGTPLHSAAIHNKAEAIRILARLGANLESRDNYGGTPLHSAAFHNEAEAIRILAGLGANLESRDNYGWTPLHSAASYNKAEAIRILAGLGANLESRDNHGGTPLHSAAFHNEAEAIRILAGLGANLESRDNHGRTPLHSAAIHNKAEAIRILAGLGANLESRDNHGRTPLHSAESVNKAEAIRILLELRATPEAQS